MQKSLEPWALWDPDGDAATHPPAAAGSRERRALARMAESAPPYFRDAEFLSARRARLPFYRQHALVHLTFTRAGRPDRVYLLDGPDATHWLDGSSAPIHETNAAEQLALTDETVLDYTRFFLFFLRGDEGAFTLVEAPTEVRARGKDDAWFDQFRSELNFPVAKLWMRLQRAREQVKPLALGKKDEEGRWLLEAVLAYGRDLYRATLAVAPDGQITMLDDQPIDTLDELEAPAFAALGLEPAPEPVEEHASAGEPAEAPAARRDPVREIIDQKVELPRDREVTEAVVAVLLEDAIRARDRNVLLQHFNAETDTSDPLEGLARLVAGSAPIIVLESDIPFVEDFVAGLLEGPGRRKLKGKVARAAPMDHDDSRLEVTQRGESTGLHLLSFHAYRGAYDVERAAHDLAIGDAAVLVGCARLADVPEPLRRVTDLILHFPRIDRRRFARIFERVFQVKPPAGWDAPGADWTRYLVPADFHAPRRLGLPPEQAVAFLRERVTARLRQVTPDAGPSLADLHGLGEARQIAEDLITDIRAAQAGQIPWTAVDRGLLLVGAPGTGKTTLARAIARECGVKFIPASAASWQAAGFLDAHLRALRADFAEARRYAPSILFLDEVDSIGNRERLSGPATQYQTEVINALLEQIQGIDTGDPVIVIGATNHVDKVDPALRRAGRLDQVVPIPLPNVAGLEQIFDYYLTPHRATGGVAPDVAARPLAELAFGLTGADAEFFVRGAARRARREGRPIAQADLVAEVTRRPRRPDSAPRLGPEAMRRVAVHEAGHVVASLVSSTRGEDLTFVTIVPRTDGSLGFVASLPPEGSMITRRTAMERLEAMLAGRAAEEIVFGAEQVGMGAGGRETSSDLAVATRLATLVVCQSGLGEDGSLHWTERPTPAQEAQIDALLRRAYSGIVARLESRRELLERVIDALVQHQELAGAALRELLAAGKGAGT